MGIFRALSKYNNKILNKFRSIFRINFTYSWWKLNGGINNFSSEIWWWCCGGFSTKRNIRKPIVPFSRFRLIVIRIRIIHHDNLRINLYRSVIMDTISIKKIMFMGIRTIDCETRTYQQNHKYILHFKWLFFFEIKMTKNLILQWFTLLHVNSKSKLETYRNAW